MKTGTVRILACMTLSGTLLAGCVYHERTAVTPSGEVVVVKEAPPEPRHEVIGVAPSPSHVWISGYWSYRNGRYVWVPGHYENRPHTASVWVAGHWDHTSRGWVWTPGHWES